MSEASELVGKENTKILIKWGLGQGKFVTQETEDDIIKNSSSDAFSNAE